MDTRYTKVKEVCPQGNNTWKVFFIFFQLAVMQFIPKDVFPLIFGYASGKDRSSIRSTCKFFSTLCPPLAMQGVITKEEELLKLFDMISGIQMWKGRTLPKATFSLLPEYFCGLIPAINALEVNSLTLIILHGTDVPLPHSIGLGELTSVKELQLSSSRLVSTFPRSLETLSASSGFSVHKKHLPLFWILQDFIESEVRKIRTLLIAGH